MDELDLLIIGGYYGEGKRSNIISQFLLAVASNEQVGGESKCYYSFSKVGSGYSHKELHELSAKLEQHWQEYNPSKPPNNLIIGGGRKEQPDLWIEPSKSQIVQVKATEIVRSKSYATNCTLRFPRVEKIRYDKSWRDCMTITELEDLRNLAQGRLATKRSSVTEEDEEPSPKKQRLPKERIVCIAPHFRPTDISNVEQISDIFKEKEMCVIFSSLEKKQAVEKKIAQSGGKLVQNPGSNTFCVVCDKITVKVKNLINTDMYDIVKENWIDNCLEMKKILPWTPGDLYHAKAETQEMLSKYYDKYGDSFTDDVTEESLRKLFANIPEKDWLSKNITNNEIAEIEKTCFSNLSPYGLFRECWILINFETSATCEQILSNNLKLLELQIKLYGGNICSDLNEKTTHVVISSGVNSHSLKHSQVHVVTENWVSDCIKERRLLEEENYFPVQQDSDDSTQPYF